LGGWGGGDSGLDGMIRAFPRDAVMGLLLSFLDPSPALAFQFASPGPVIAEWGWLTLRWYGLLIASAVLIGVNLSQALAQRRRVEPELLSDLALWLVLAAIPSARLYYVLFQWRDYADQPGKIIAIWEGGIAIHGAVLGGLVASLIFARIRRVAFWQLADLVAPALILGQAIGRWGNFFNSEAFGSPTDLPWKLFIPEYRRPLGSADVAYYHPTFLYESLWNLMVFAVLMLLFRRSLRSPAAIKVGTLFLVYLVGYGAGRVWIEALRTDSLMLGPLKVAQVVSLTQVAVGIAGLVWLYGRGRSLPDVVAESGEIANKKP
jgi:phosphatidylglycerol---prolipoprotein diacylglyceryl transferase